MIDCFIINSKRIINENKNMAEIHPRPEGRGILSA